ncbi:MAG: aminotransferase class IV family protein [Candidatus Komeilibacteria bacterium]|nr:aminotransferase class IV family protein [Candidatus Komeilibacteria bacterium]
MNFKYFSKNGKILPIEEAAVPLSNIEYQYGFGVYETIRVNDGIPFFLKDHIERLEESARIIGLTHEFDDAFVGRCMHELVKKNGGGTCNLKILLIGGKEPQLNILCLNPLFPDKKLYRDGADFITYEYERPFPHAKTLNMLQSYLAYKKAKEAGCYDALLINDMGCITEGTRTNFFLIDGKTLISPPEEEILLGVTRKAVLYAAKMNGHSLVQQEIQFSHALAAQGAFITSTSSKIIPVRSIDGRALATPPAGLRELMDAYDQFLASCRGKLPE